MNRSLLMVILAVLFLGGVVFGVGAIGKSWVKQNVGDLGPALSPIRQNPPQVAGEAIDQLTLPEGFQVTLFSSAAPGARDLQFSPDGTLLVSLRTQGKVIALPDTNADGQADSVVEVLTGLKNPHGLVFRDGKLFVAEERQVSRYTWDESELTATLEKKIVDLPSGGAGHFTRSLVFDSQGNLYISIGSTCNVCDEKDERNASVMITNAEGESPRIYASGLRNAVFMTLRPSTDKVWVSENSRDLLGDNIPPDEINILEENANYGWPYCYGAQVRDSSFGDQPTSYCDNTVVPTAELQAHSAALGLTFVDSRQFPDDWQGDLLVAFHGSWNRSIPTGYKVVRLKVDGERVTGQEDFITGFLKDGQTMGRPVDITFDSLGRMYLSDDKAGAVYVVTGNQE